MFSPIWESRQLLKLRSLLTSEIRDFSLTTIFSAFLMTQYLWIEYAIWDIRLFSFLVNWVPNNISDSVIVWPTAFFTFIQRFFTIGHCEMICIWDSISPQIEQYLLIFSFSGMRWIWLSASPLGAENGLWRFLCMQKSKTY